MIMYSSTYLLKTYIYTWNSQVQRCSCTFIKYFPKSLSQFIFLSAMYENTHFFSILLFTLGIFNYLRAENGNLVLFALKKKLLQIINTWLTLKKKNICPYSFLIFLLVFIFLTDLQKPFVYDASAIHYKHFFP